MHTVRGSNGRGHHQRQESAGVTRRPVPEEFQHETYAAVEFPRRQRRWAIPVQCARGQAISQPLTEVGPCI